MFNLEICKFIRSREAKVKGWYGRRNVQSPDAPEKRHIGITMVTLNPDLLLNLRVQHRDLMNVEHGVLIYRVILGSPADEGGIQPGDIMTEMNGQKIKSSDDVYKALDSTCEKIDVTVIRGQSVLKLTVTPEIVE